MIRTMFVHNVRYAWRWVFNVKCDMPGCKQRRTTTQLGDYGRPVWDSGVSGAECDECDEVTIVRVAGRDWMDEPTGWICRACAEGWREDEEDSGVSS